MPSGRGGIANPLEGADCRRCKAGVAKILMAIAQRCHVHFMRDGLARCASAAAMSSERPDTYSATPPPQSAVGSERGTCRFYDPVKREGQSDCR
jgi:hypothetical protein